MKLIKKIQDMESWRCGITGEVGFVPTMGALHKGHLSLVALAKANADFVVVSIFVNPLQFGLKEDFKSYPGDLKQDRELLEKYKVDVLFVPENDEIYPPGYSTYVEVPELSSVLCGLSRPAHFRGVCTIVCKLFNIVKPDIAVFGEKDAQQAIIIKKMVQDLNLGVKIITGETIREKDGLAVSSRNAYLTKEERGEAPVIYQALKTAKAMIKRGERNVNKIRNIMKVEMLKSPPRRPATAGDTAGQVQHAKIDYIEIVSTKNLKPVKILSGEILIAVAVKFGKARLIDNITVLV